MHDVNINRHTLPLIAPMMSTLAHFAFDSMHDVNINRKHFAFDSMHDVNISTLCLW